MQIWAEDEESGYKTFVNNLEVHITPDCSLEGVIYDTGLETSIRINDPPTESILIDPRFKPALGSQCPDQLITIEILGPDAQLISEK